MVQGDPAYDPGQQDLPPCELPGKGGQKSDPDQPPHIDGPSLGRHPSRAWISASLLVLQ
jgi:hypothetical protein